LGLSLKRSGEQIITLTSCGAASVTQKRATAARRAEIRCMVLILSEKVIENEFLILSPL
jgi:hypothetical protein